MRIDDNKQTFLCVYLTLLQSYTRTLYKYKALCKKKKEAKRSLSVLSLSLETLPRALRFSVFLRQLHATPLVEMGKPNEKERKKERKARETGRIETLSVV
jgi:hypothetical protein